MLNDLNPSTRRILEETEDLTKKKFRFQVVDELNTFAKVKAARKSMKEHIILCRGGFDDVLNHIIAHECGHIIRIFSAPESERVMPFSNQEHFNRFYDRVSDIIPSFSSVLEPGEIDSLLNRWHQGTVSQVTNQPVDIMIEKWIYSEYPDLRDYQMISIRRQCDDALKSLEDKVRRFTHPFLFEISNLMNYAFFRHLGLFMGENFIKPYSSTPFLVRGKKLSSLLDEVSEDTLAGDIKKINMWVEFLDIEGWFEWTDFEKVPPGYEEAL